MEPDKEQKFEEGAFFRVQKGNATLMFTDCNTETIYIQENSLFIFFWCSRCKLWIEKCAQQPLSNTVPYESSSSAEEMRNSTVMLNGTGPT